MMGPTLSSPLSEVMIKGLINDFHLHKEQHSVIHYYQSLPVFKQPKIYTYKHASLLHDLQRTIRYSHDSST
ncbi:hypothetical protein GCM10020331_088140 [Ectobacillus funiculus]